MTVEIKSPCCGARTCQRQQPMRLLYVDGDAYVLTQYSEREHGGISEVFQEHQLSRRDAEEFVAEWMADHPNLAPADRAVTPVRKWAKDSS